MMVRNPLDSAAHDSSDAEEDLTRALARLIDGEPLCPKLRRLAEQGKLRINFSTVAEEAGRSRTLIGHENCRYPNVRQAVKNAMYGQKGKTGEDCEQTGGTTAYDVIQDLRTENAILRSEKAILATKVVETQVVVRRLEQKLEREVRRRERSQRRSKPNKLVGREFPHEADVLAFPANPSQETRERDT